MNRIVLIQGRSVTAPAEHSQTDVPIKEARRYNSAPQVTVPLKPHISLPDSCLPLGDAFSASLR